MHPATASLLNYFQFQHLPPYLAEVSEPFCKLAAQMSQTLDGPELTAGLRKLLEAKDCMVRAALDKVRTMSSPSDDERRKFVESMPAAERSKLEEMINAKAREIEAIRKEREVK